MAAPLEPRASLRRPWCLPRSGSICKAAGGAADGWLPVKPVRSSCSSSVRGEIAHGGLAQKVQDRPSHDRPALVCVARVVIAAVATPEQTAVLVRQVVEVRSDGRQRELGGRYGQSEAALRPPRGLQDPLAGHRVQDLGQVVARHAQLPGDVVDAHQSPFGRFRKTDRRPDRVGRGFRQDHRLARP